MLSMLTGLPGWIKIAGAAVFALAIVSYVGFSLKMLVDGAKEKERLAHNLAVYEQLAKNREKRLVEVRAQLETERLSREKALEDFERARKKVSDLEAKLEGHDLEKIAVAKPGLLERRVQAGTAEVFGEFESLSRRP